ncbi:hypothetical protein PSHT_08333, partial [Puccinia striiformis]
VSSPFSKNIGNTVNDWSNSHSCCVKCQTWSLALICQLVPTMSSPCRHQSRLRGIFYHIFNKQPQWHTASCPIRLRTCSNYSTHKLFKPCLHLELLTLILVQRLTLGLYKRETSQNSNRPCSYSKNQKEKVNKLVKRKLEEIDIENPNLYQDLKRQLWKYFKDDLINKNMVITPLPQIPVDHISLSQGTSCLPDLQTLLAYISKAKKKPVPIDIVYEEPSNNPTRISSRIASSINIKLTTQSSLASTTSTKQHGPSAANNRRGTILNPDLTSTVRRKTNAMDDRWAQGSIAGTVPVRLFNQLQFRWMEVAVRLTFKAEVGSTQTQAPDLLLFNINATASPLTLSVDKTTTIGTGSMRVAYPAWVKTILEDGTENITHWVAKERFIDTFPPVINHATDTRMYQAFALLLQEFKRLGPAVDLHWQRPDPMAHNNRQTGATLEPMQSNRPNRTAGAPSIRF